MTRPSIDLRDLSTRLVIFSAAYQFKVPNYKCHVEFLKGHTSPKFPTYTFFKRFAAVT